MRPMRCFFLGALCTLACSAVQAHPHVWVDARADIVFSPSGAITAIRHVWTFDEAFTAYMVLGLDIDEDGAFSRDELAELAQLNVTSLADYHFFTSIAGASHDDRLGDIYSETFQPAIDYYLQHDGMRASLHFTLPLENEVIAPDYDLVVVDIYDPEYFVAISLVDDQPVQMAGAPEDCLLSVDEPPALDDSYANILSLIPAEGAVPEELLSVTAQLANRARIICG